MLAKLRRKLRRFSTRWLCDIRNWCAILINSLLELYFVLVSEYMLCFVLILCLLYYILADTSMLLHLFAFYTISITTSSK